MERSTRSTILLAAVLHSWLAGALWGAPSLPPPPPNGPREPTLPPPRLAPTPSASAPNLAGQYPGYSGPPWQKSPLELSAPAGGEVVKMAPPPLEPGDLCFPINLAVALRLADARPLIVAYAQASAWIAEAQYQKAKVLWLPSFVVNSSFLRHDGLMDFNRGVNVPPGLNVFGQPDPASFGKPLNQNFNWWYTGGSFYQVVAVTDAIFQPLAARQELNAKRWDIQTAKNDILQETARSYFNVHRFRGRYAGAIYCVEQGRILLAKINTLREDLIPRVEVDRARNLLAFLEEEAVSDRENWRVASADLTQILRLDPRAVVQPLEPDHLQITLIDAARSLDDLIPIGLANRPELAAQQALIQAAAVRIRQEKLRPLLPNILLTGFQAPGGMTTEFGVIGTGQGGKMNNWSFRDDISAQIVWQLQEFGFGNAALVKKRRGEQSQAFAELYRIQDTVASEVTTAQANVQGAGAKVVQAERSLQNSLVTFRANLEGLGQTKRFENVLHVIYRPQESVYALKLLKQAFDEYFDTVAEYNQSQFELFHALGYPAREIELLRSPGELVPVETSRPSYLPAVGIGPPPAPR
jgi:outer membrane protein TolC